MKRYEQIQKLYDDRDSKIKEIEEEYRKAIEDFDCEFSIDQIESNGWVKVGFYPAGNEYIYQKNNRLIACGKSHAYAIVRTPGRIFSIYDYEHLEDYANGIAYQNVNFYESDVGMYL